MTWYNPLSWGQSDSTQETEEEEEDEEPEYPKEWVEDRHIATKFTRTHATVHYKDGSTEQIVYDVREDNERTIDVAMYDHENDFHAKEPSFYYSNHDADVVAVKHGATEEQQTFNLDSVKKIEVRYRDQYVAFADVEQRKCVRECHSGTEEIAILETPQREIDWSYMIIYEYEEKMRRREEE